jgi:hypothetical protein
MKTAEVKQSMELDKLSLINRDMYKEVLDQNNTFELLFEKNLPPTARELIETQSSGSKRKEKGRGRKTHRPEKVILELNLVVSNSHKNTAL